MNKHDIAGPGSPLEEGMPCWAEIVFEVKCPQCKYDLRLLKRPVCPECGTLFCWEEVLARAEYERCSFVKQLLQLFCSSFKPQSLSLTSDFDNRKREFSILVCLFLTSVNIPLVVYHTLAWCVGWLSLKGIEDAWVSPKIDFTLYMIVNALAEGARVPIDMPIARLIVITSSVTIIATTTILIMASPPGRSGQRWNIRRILSLVLLAMLPSALWFGCLLYGRFVIVAFWGAIGFGSSNWAIIAFPVVIVGIFCKYLVAGIRRELTCERPTLLAMLASTGAIAIAGIIWVVTELAMNYG